MKTIYLVKHSGPFVDIKNYENYENVLWEDYILEDYILEDYNRNMILSVEGKKEQKNYVK